MSTKTKKAVKPLYKATELTKKSNGKLWVAFKSGSVPSKGMVYGSTLSRDQVRNVASKELGVKIQDVRARRVSNMSSRRLKNTK